MKTGIIYIISLFLTACTSYSIGKHKHSYDGIIPDIGFVVLLLFWIIIWLGFIIIYLLVK